MASRYGVRGLNDGISSYLRSHYNYLVHLDLIKDIFEGLPTDDRYFIDNFKFGMIPRAKKMVCGQRLQIRAGLITPEAARALAPRPVLVVEALKRKHR